MSRGLAARSVAFAMVPSIMLALALQPTGGILGAPRDDAVPLGSQAPEQASAALRPASSVLTETAEPVTVRRHVVQAGETLAAIASRFGVTRETIAYNNALAHAAAIVPGQELRIPPMDAAIYAVHEGDTVEGVAARYGADPNALMELNRLYFEPERFAVGETIIVPVPEGRFPGYALASAPQARAQTIARAAPAPVTYAARGRLLRPVNGVITQQFSSAHPAVDISAPYGTAVGASDAGVVSAVGWVSIGGLRACVRHPWGMETCYYHLSATYVGASQAVAAGQAVGAIGLTGVTTGPHVHWEARYNGVLVNPLAY